MAAPSPATSCWCLVHLSWKKRCWSRKNAFTMHCLCGLGTRRPAYWAAHVEMGVMGKERTRIIREMVWVSSYNPVDMCRWVFGVMPIKHGGPWTAGPLQSLGPPDAVLVSASACHLANVAWGTGHPPHQNPKRTARRVLFTAQIHDAFSRSKFKTPVRSIIFSTLRMWVKAIPTNGTIYQMFNEHVLFQVAEENTSLQDVNSII